MLFLRFERRLHRCTMLVAGTGGKLLHALLGGAPFDNCDFDNATTPLVHKAARRLVDVDGSCSYKGTTVVIDNVDIGLSLDFKFGAQWVDGPVGSGAAFLFIINEVGADGIFRTIAYVIALCMGVGRGAHNTVELLRVVKGHAMLVASQIGQLGGWAR